MYIAAVALFLPLFGLVTLLIPVFVAVEWLSLGDSTNRIFVTISTSIITIAGSCFMAVSNRTGKYVTVVQILLCVLASCFLFRPYFSFNNAEVKIESSERMLEGLEESGALSWEVYHKYCIPLSQSNRIPTQIRCLHLDGTEIRHWDGIVLDIGIGKVFNWRRDFVKKYFPVFKNYIFCYFGEINQANCFEGEICDIKEFIDGDKRCNVDKWNK